MTLSRNIFARLGIPKILVSDNGRSLVSKEFEEWLVVNGIEHRTIPVGHAQTNGQAENGVKGLKMALKKAMYNQLSGTNINRVLANFLLDFRNTDHGTTGKARTVNA